MFMLKSTHIAELDKIRTALGFAGSRLNAIDLAADRRLEIERLYRDLAAAEKSNEIAERELVKLRLKARQNEAAEQPVASAKKAPARKGKAK